MKIPTVHVPPRFAPFVRGITYYGILLGIPVLVVLAVGLAIWWIG